MATIELPHTAGCLVCGRSNPHGLHLSLHVDPQTGEVTTALVTRPQDVGFAGVVHGGVLATVLDEAMVWAATWAGRRFCVCAELTTRFLKEAAVGRELVIETKVEANRSRLITTAAAVRDLASGDVVATASAKYVPVPRERNRAFVDTLVDDPATDDAARVLRAASATG